MIQRIQTVFLVLAAIANFVLIFAHIGYYAHSEEDLSAEAYGMKIVVTPPMDSMDDIAAWAEHREAENPENVVGLGENLFHTFHFGLVILNSIYLLGLIFLFGDRVRQMKLAYMGILMLMVQIAIGTLFLFNLESFTNEMFSIDAAPNAQFGPRAEMGLAILAMIFTWLAARRIKKDEQLVRDANRLR